MANETDITLLQDLSLPLVGTDYVEVRRGAELYRCHGDWLTGGGEPYVLKATGTAPDIGYTNVYPVGGAMGTPPAPGQAGDWFEALIPNAAGDLVNTRRYVSHDGIGWVHVDEDIQDHWAAVTVANSPVNLTWDQHRILDLTGTTALARLIITVSGIPSGDEKGHIIFRSLPGASWSGGFATINFNNGDVVPAPIPVTVDAGTDAGGVILISDRAIGGAEFIYSTNGTVYGYSLSLEP